MPTTLSYGYVKPATGDTGSTLFTNLQNDIQQLNDHNHDGSNSAALSLSSLSRFSSSVSSGSWSSDGNGNYSQVITVPSQISGAPIYNDIIYYNMIVKTTAGDVVYPQIERVTSTTFRLRVNDNTLDLNVYYT